MLRDRFQRHFFVFSARTGVLLRRCHLDALDNLWQFLNRTAAPGGPQPVSVLPIKRAASIAGTRPNALGSWPLNSFSSKRTFAHAEGLLG